MKQVHWIFGICLFTASFDIILNFNVGGSLRLTQILMIFVSLAALARALQDGRILWPRGATAVSLWIVVQALFLPFSGIISIGLQFFALLFFTVFGIFAVVQLYGLSDLIEPLMRVYLGSYVFVAAVGLLQFLLPVLHLPTFLARQWIVHGRIARINAFSYEPSYFATYMIIGWITLVDLRLTKAEICNSPFWKWATVAVTASVFLSTSKTAWVFMILELVSRILPPVWKAFRASLNHGRLAIRIPGRHMFGYAVLLSAILVIAGHFITQLVDPSVFLAGTGLANTPAHSLNDRTNAMFTTWEAFKQTPFVGRSLGGVPIFIASRGGYAVHNMADVRNFWGFPVLLDVLVASGLFGFIPFAVFLYTNTIGALRFAKPRMPQERAKWLHALARAMIFEWLLLMTDQNLLRVYLWYHFAMVTLVAYHLEFAPAPPITIHRKRRPIMIFLEEPATQ